MVERSPVVTRFDTREFLDIGGFVNIRLRMDDDKMNGYMYQVSISTSRLRLSRSLRGAVSSISFMRANANSIISIISNILDRRLLKYSVLY